MNAIIKSSALVFFTHAVISQHLTILHSYEELCVFKQLIGRPGWHCIYLAKVNKVVVKDDLDRARQLSSWRVLGHLLDAQSLMVTVDGESILRLQRVTIFILAGREGR